MSKALVIKGANFSTNKVTSLTFGSIPCTGIELDESTINITDYDPITLGYTVTPSNTTDGITWTSSDENVISVANGVITPVGIGTAIITAMCGNFSDSVTVNVNIAYIPSYMFATLAANGIAPNEFPACSPSSNRIIVMGSGQQAGEYKCLGKEGIEEDKNIIKLPKNVASITVKNTNKAYVHNGTYTKIFWTKDESCGAELFPQCAKLISSEQINFYTTQEYSFDVPSGADSFMFVIRTASSYTSEDNAATIMENMGFSLTFNTASEQ